MADISPVSGAGTDRPEQTSATERSFGRTESKPRQRPSDRVELSDRARYLGKMAELPPVRRELIDQVRRQIEADTYDSEERLDAAINSLSDDLDLLG